MKPLKVFKKFIRPMMAEFLGQFTFVFLHSCTAFTISTQPGGSANNALLPAVSDGFTVAMIVMTLGHISGAHVNAAVTTAIFIAGGIKWYMTPLYVISQLLGSLAGAGLANVVNGASSGSFGLAPGVTIEQGVVMEIALSFLLTFTILMAGVELKSEHAPFAVAFVVIAAIMAGFGVSGSCMNPSLSFGPAVIAGRWENYWIYWVCPLAGALISGLLFRLIFSNETRWIFKNAPQPRSRQSEKAKEAGELSSEDGDISSDS